tara:strand:- start:167 stop:739 length:573 start_codon:yes stop_codon:yes gene_type:complete
MSNSKNLNKNTYLNHIGIDVWRMRDPSSSGNGAISNTSIQKEKLCPYCNSEFDDSSLYDVDTQSKLMILYESADRDSIDFDKSQDEKYIKLIEAIVSSIGFKREDVIISRLCCKQNFKNDAKEIKPKNIILMGKTITSNLSDKKNNDDIPKGDTLVYGVPAIITHSIKDIYMNIKLKKDLWLNIKHLSIK